MIISFFQRKAISWYIVNLWKRSSFETRWITPLSVCSFPSRFLSMNSIFVAVFEESKCIFIESFFLLELSSEIFYLHHGLCKKCICAWENRCLETDRPTDRHGKVQSHVHRARDWKYLTFSVPIYQYVLLHPSFLILIPPIPYSNPPPYSFPRLSPQSRCFIPPLLLLFFIIIIVFIFVNIYPLSFILPSPNIVCSIFLFLSNHFPSPPIYRSLGCLSGDWLSWPVSPVGWWFQPSEIGEQGVWVVIGCFGWLVLLGGDFSPVR